jgi:hypothetical protein
MKKASQEKARARRTPSAAQSSGKPVKPVVTQGARPETYTAKVLGQPRAVSRWTGDGNLLLADGTEFVFKPVGKPTSDYLDRKLHSVASLEKAGDDWLIDGKSLSMWLRLETGPRLARRRGIPAVYATPTALVSAFFRAKADEMDPDFFRYWALNSELSQLDPATSGSVRAVAWFESADELQGQDEPMLLCKFRKIQASIKELPACSPIEKHEQKLSWWHDSEITNITGTTKRGEKFVIPIPDALREVLRLLLEKPGEPVSLARLKDSVNEMRATTGYRAAKNLDSAEARELQRVGVLERHKTPGGKLVSYSVVPPSNPVS